MKNKIRKGGMKERCPISGYPQAALSLQRTRNACQYCRFKCRGDQAPFHPLAATINYPISFYLPHLERQQNMGHLNL